MHSKTWKKIKCILSSERSKSEKTIYFMIPTIWYFRKSKTMKTIKRSVVARVWVGAKAETWIDRTQGFLGWWNYSVWYYNGGSVQFSSVAQSCPTLCNPMDYSMPGLPVHHQLPEFTQTHVHWVGDAIQSSHPSSSPSPTAINLSQHQGLFKWVSSSYQVAKVLEFQPQHQFF